MIRVVVLPGNWKLPRAFRFEGSALQVEPGRPPGAKDDIVQTARHEWQIAPRWSQEALAEAAHGVTCWYMGKVGEVIYAKGVPKAWGKMSASEAGRTRSR